MASIAKRPNGRWRARYRDAEGREHAKHEARKIDAQRWLDEATADLITGAYVDPRRGSRTVGAQAEEWRAGKVNLSPTTQARYDSALAVHVLPRWGTVPLAKVQHGEVQAWVVAMSAGGQSGASVRKAYGVLSGILASAVKDRRLAVNPAAAVNLPRARAARRRYLTAGQVQALAAAAGAFGPVVLTLSYCGLRWSEMAALRVGRFDPLRRRIEVAEAVTEVNGARLHWGEPKSHERRSVPVPRFLLGELTHLAHGRQRDELLFTAAGGGVLRNRNARRAWFDKAATAIGQDGLRPHELRHTAASLAVSAGANVKAVQRMLGHASAAMTLDTYSDLFDDDLDAVAERLDAVAMAVPDSAADLARTAAPVLDLAGSGSCL